MDFAQYNFALASWAAQLGNDPTAPSLVCQEATFAEEHMAQHGTAQPGRGAADSRRRPVLTTPPRSHLAFVVIKARAFDAEVPASGSEDGSDMVDDKAVAALESSPDNPNEEELLGALRDLNVDQLNEVVALVLVGRGDFTVEEWPQALQQARAVSERRGVQYLIETPLLGDLIEDGLDELGYNITDEEMQR